MWVVYVCLTCSVVEEERGARGGQRLSRSVPLVSCFVAAVNPVIQGIKVFLQKQYFFFINENFAVLFNRANIDLSRLSVLQNSPFSTTSKKKPLLRTLLAGAK